MPADVKSAVLSAAILAVISWLLSGCGRGATGNHVLFAVQNPKVDQTVSQPADQVPGHLPRDGLLPGEALDKNGFVIPNRRTSYINDDSVFIPGILRFIDSGAGINTDGKILHMLSGDAGSRQSAWAVYRLTMGGAQPGAVAWDVNRMATSAGDPSTYWVGLSDFGHDRWQWHGPFADHHVRLSTAAAARQGEDFVSPLGNLFICILAFDGASLGVVGASANPLDGADSEAPSKPIGLSATPYNGCLELSWKGVIADDLAGYRIYYSDQEFASTAEDGVVSVAYLEDVPHHVLRSDGNTWIRVSAVDVNGNESPPSDSAVGQPLAGDVPQLLLAANRASGLLGDTITILGIGAAHYSWDLDTDGLYEVTGDAIGEQALQPEQIGILRPSMLGFQGETGMSLFGISLLIVANNSPVAVLTSDVMAGEEPLAANLDASESWDSDGIIINYEWDIDGDDRFNEPGDEAELQGSSAFPYVFEDAGYRLIQVRVTDDIYAQDTATIEIVVRGWVIHTIEASIGEGAGRCALAIVDGAPALCYVDASDHDLRYVRSLSATGVRRSDWEEIITVDPDCWVGSYPSLAIIEDRPAIAYEDTWNYDLRYIRALNSTGSNPYDWPTPAVVDSNGWVGDDPSLAVVDGNPAISYYDLSKADLKYARADTSTGQSTGDWTQVATVDSEGIVGASSTLAVVDGHPAISYTDWTEKSLKYVRATTAAGASEMDWPAPVVIDNTGELGDCRSLTVVDGHPALTYFMEQNPVTHGTFDLIYARAKTSTGEYGFDWTQLVTVDSDGETGCFSSLAVIADCPGASYFDRSINALKFAHSSSPAGTGTGDWDTIAMVDMLEHKGYATTLIEVAGSPAIAYVVATNPSSTDKCLKYAWYFQ